MREIIIRKADPKILWMFLAILVTIPVVGYFTMGREFVRGLSTTEIFLLSCPLPVLALILIFSIKDYYWEPGTGNLQQTYPFVPGLSRKKYPMGCPRRVLIREQTTENSNQFGVLVECDKVVRIACKTESEAKSIAQKLTEFSSTPLGQKSEHLGPIETKFQSQFQTKFYSQEDREYQSFIQFLAQDTKESLQTC